MTFFLRNHKLFSKYDLNIDTWPETLCLGIGILTPVRRSFVATQVHRGRLEFKEIGHGTSSPMIRPGTTKVRARTLAPMPESTKVKLGTLALVLRSSMPRPETSTLVPWSPVLGLGSAEAGLSPSREGLGPCCLCRSPRCSSMRPHGHARVLDTCVRLSGA